jgi:hypothetical protein
MSKILVGFIIIVVLFVIFSGVWVGLCKYNQGVYFCEKPWSTGGVSGVRNIKVEKYTSKTGNYAYTVSWDAPTAGNGDPSKLYYSWSVWKGQVTTPPTSTADDSGTTQLTNFNLGSKFSDEAYITVGIQVKYGTGTEWVGNTEYKILNLGIPPKITNVMFTPPVDTSSCSSLSYQISVDPNTVVGTPTASGDIYINQFDYTTGKQGSSFIPIPNTSTNCTFSNNSFNCNVNLSQGECQKSFYGNNMYYVGAKVCDSGNIVCSKFIGASGSIKPISPVLDGKINIILDLNK